MLIVVHGGPTWDHTYLLPVVAELADLARKRPLTRVKVGQNPPIRTGAPGNRTVPGGTVSVAGGFSGHRKWPSYRAAQPVTPTATATASSSPAAACRLLTAAQVRHAVGRPIGHASPLPPGVCVYDLPGGAGTVNFGVTSYPSAAQARHQFEQREQADTGVRGLTVTKIRDVGQEAVTLTDSRGVSAMVLAGSKELDVDISLTGATSAMAATLAAEAIRRI